MSEIAIVSSALPRLEHACRTRGVREPGGGARLTPAQLRILEQLDTDDPVMVTELADFLGVTASTMSLNLKRLQEAGVVRRSRDPADRRVVNVLLTGEGERLRTLATPYDPHRIAAVLERLRPEDRRRALDGLALLADAADAVSAAGRSYVEALAGGDGAGES